MISSAWKTNLESISSVYGYWLLCSGIKVVTKNMALFWFYIYFSMSILLKHKKVLTSLEKDIKVSIYVSYTHIVFSYYGQVSFINKSHKYFYG